MRNRIISDSDNEAKRFPPGTASLGSGTEEGDVARCRAGLRIFVSSARCNKHTVRHGDINATLRILAGLCGHFRKRLTACSEKFRRNFQTWKNGLLWL